MPESATLHAAREILPQLRTWRRWLHARPELSGQEERTARFVADELRKLGYQPQEHVGDGFGLTAELRVEGAPLAALRADMDALPIQEETGLEFASQSPGVMHACGHDAHTAMLLGAAKILHERRSSLRRSVRFIFQPHEELYPGGAPGMIKAGALQGVESIFGLHIISVLPAGVVGTRSGPFMAAINDIDITITGKGGHAAMPEDCIDPIVAAAHIVTALQSVASRSIAMTDAAVVSVTQFHAGTADNIIPNQVKLRGTIRTFDEQVRARVCTRVREVAESIARAQGATAEVSLQPGYPVLVNDERVAARALDAARGLGLPEQGLRTLPLQGGGEDFAYYCQHAPGAFVFLGAAVAEKERQFPHHHPRFDIDEEMLPCGAALLAQYVLQAGESAA